MNSQSYSENKKEYSSLNSLKKTCSTDKNESEQERNLSAQNQLNNDEFPYLAHRDELTNGNVFFIAIKLSNNQYIYEWFKSKEKASYIYSYAMKFDKNLKNRSFRLVDNDNGELVEPNELISNTLKCIHKGNSRTRFSLSVKFEII